MNDTRAYLYFLKDDGTLSVHEGGVSPKFHNWQRHVRFTPDKGNWCYVSSEPYEVYYRKVWMPERDDERAKMLYIEYHERKIKECEKNLEMHKQAVATLKESTDRNLSI